MIEIKDDVGAVLHRVDAATLAGASLANCYLRKADLAGADLRGANLRDADLREANLQGADLRDAKIDDANFENANLESANLEGVTVESAKTNFTSARLVNAKLMRIHLSLGNLNYANLEGADLTGATIGAGTMQGVDLSHAVMDGAWIVVGEMRWARLRGADFSKVRYMYALRLHEAFFDHTTKWPRDFSLLRSAIGRLNVWSATVTLGVCLAGIGYLFHHPWIGGLIGAALAYFGWPLLLWLRLRLVADIPDRDTMRVFPFLIAIGLVVSWFNSGTTPAPTALTDFTISWQQGLLTENVSVTFQGTQTGGKPIERAEFSLTVYFQSDQKPVVHQYRELWRPGETITVNLPAQGTIERVELTGTGKIDGHDRDLTGTWVTTAKTQP